MIDHMGANGRGRLRQSSAAGPVGANTTTAGKSRPTKQFIAAKPGREAKQLLVVFSISAFALGFCLAAIVVAVLSRIR